MKYLLSKLLSTEDAVKFMYEHDEAEEIVPEHLRKGAFSQPLYKKPVKPEKPVCLKHLTQGTALSTW